MQNNSRATLIQTFVSFPILATVLVILCSAPRAQADGVVASDFLFQMDNAVLQTPAFDLRKMLAGQAHFNVDSFVYQDKAPVSVSGITVDLKYQFQSSSDYPLIGTEITVASTSFTGQINIGKIDVDAQIVHEENGTIAIGRLKASCRDIVVELLPGKARVVGSLAVLVGDDGLPTAQIPWINVEWSEDAWEVRSLSCTGARGFDSKVKKALREYLKKGETFQPRLKSYIDDQILLYRLQMQNFFVQPIDLPLGVDGVSAVLYPERIQNIQGDRFQVRGRIEMTFAHADNFDLLETSEAAIMPTQPGYALSVPPAFVASINQMAYATGHYARQKFGSEIKGFTDFRASSLAVSVVWPELGWYPKEMDFRFDFKAANQPQLQGLNTNGSGSLSTAVNFVLNVDVFAQRFGVPSVEYTAFDHFRSLATADLSASFTATSLGSELTLAFGTPKLPLTHAWDPSYPVRNTTVATSTISTKIEEALAVTPVKLSVGSFTLNPNTSLRASGFRQLDKWLLLDLSK